MKSIFEYSDYRRYLQDYYSWAKNNLRQFSHRAFLTKAGMSGPNYLKRVMEGVHKLTDNSIPKFASALNLSDKEEQYFRHLVYFNDAKTLEEKDRLFETLIQLKSVNSKNVLERDQYNYYKDWYNIVLRELLAYLPYRGNPGEFGKAITPAVSAKKIKRALDLLEGLNLIEKKADGSYVQTSYSITTGEEVESLIIPKFHVAMAKLGVEAITQFNKDQRNFTSVTMSISESAYSDIVMLLHELRKKIIERVAQESEPDRVYHLNLQLFPVTSLKKKRRRRMSH